jgi:hypothetical protein
VRNGMMLRSRTFWFGLTGLAFLAWAWRDSMSYSTTLQSGCWGLGQGVGALGFSVGKEIGPVVISRDFYDSAALKMSWFPDLMIRNEGAGGIRFIVPHWIAVTSWFVLWTAFAGVRIVQRRRAKDPLLQHESDEAGG